MLFHDDVRSRLSSFEFTEKKEEKATLKIQTFPPQSKTSSRVKRGKCEEPLRDRCLRMLIAVFISSKEQCIKRPRQKKSEAKQIKKLFKLSHPFTSFGPGAREEAEARIVRARRAFCVQKT